LSETWFKRGLWLVALVFDGFFDPLRRPDRGGSARYRWIASRQAIVSLLRYLEKQRAAEQLSSSERQQELGYDAALDSAYPRDACSVP
jgi:hypothetical protein